MYASTNKQLYELQNTGFTWFLIISYLLYAAALFGLSKEFNFFPTDLLPNRLKSFAIFILNQLFLFFINWKHNF